MSYEHFILLVLTGVLWVLLLMVGFAFIVWPALGTAIQATSEETATGFAAALYIAGFSLTTLGTGDVVPLTPLYHLLTVLKAAMGFSVFSLSLTFFTSIYSALVRRNTFAISLHHCTSGTADAAVLLTRLGPDNDFSDAHSELTTMAEELINLYESHHSYSVLHYFRFQDVAVVDGRLCGQVRCAAPTMLRVCGRLCRLHALRLGRGCSSRDQHGGSLRNHFFSSW